MFSFFKNKNVSVLEKWVNSHVANAERTNMSGHKMLIVFASSGLPSRKSKIHELGGSPINYDRALIESSIFLLFEYDFWLHGTNVSHEGRNSEFRKIFGGFNDVFNAIISAPKLEELIANRLSLFAELARGKHTLSRSISLLVRIIMDPLSGSFALYESSVDIGLSLEVYQWLMFEKELVEYYSKMGNSLEEGFKAMRRGIA